MLYFVNTRYLQIITPCIHLWHVEHITMCWLDLTITNLTVVPRACTRGELTWTSTFKPHIWFRDLRITSKIKMRSLMWHFEVVCTINAPRKRGGRVKFNKLWGQTKGIPPILSSTPQFKHCNTMNQHMLRVSWTSTELKENLGFWKFAANSPIILDSVHRAQVET